MEETSTDNSVLPVQRRTTIKVHAYLNASAILFVEPLQNTCNCSCEHKSNSGSWSVVDLHRCTAPEGSAHRVNDRYRIELKWQFAHCRRLCAIHKETEKGRLCNHWRWVDNISAAGRPNTRTGQRVRDLCIIMEHQSRPCLQANVSSVYVQTLRWKCGENHGRVAVISSWQRTKP